MAHEIRRDVLRGALGTFQDRSIGLATGQSVSYEEWEEARADLMSYPELLRVLPDWVSTTRWGAQFWQFMKSTDGSYAGRREFIWSTLAPAFELIEKGATLPTDRSLEAQLAICTSAAVGEAWVRIQDRRDSDPEGAITAARTLLESTCKYLLDRLEVTYGDDDLP